MSARLDFALIPTTSGREFIVAPVWHGQAFVLIDGEKIQFGWTTDGSSIPRFLWDRVGAPIAGKHLRASILHDWLYLHRIGTRADADRRFRDQMRRDGVGWLKANAMYAAVRAFGGAAWADDD